MRCLVLRAEKRFWIRWTRWRNKCNRRDNRQKEEAWHEIDFICSIFHSLSNVRDKVLWKSICILLPNLKHFNNSFLAWSNPKDVQLRLEHDWSITCSNLQKFRWVTKATDIIQSGKGYKTVSEAFGLQRTAVRRWVDKTWNNGGPSQKRLIYLNYSKSALTTHPGGHKRT